MGKRETKGSTNSESSSAEVTSRWEDLPNMDAPQLEDNYFVESGRTCLRESNFKEQASPRTKYNILICTDFTFPKFGGVETHGY